MQDEQSETMGSRAFRSATSAVGNVSVSVWQHRVARALEEGRVALALQPVVQARATDRPAFHEGLIRIIGRTGAVFSAGTFIDAVEPTPVGRSLDRAALRLALAELSAAPDLRLAVNLSPLSIGDTEWSAILEAAIRSDPTLAERLIVEITERAIAFDLAAMRAFLDHWRANGVAFALDDFGAGSTAYRHLRDFRFDIIKIDGQFSRDIHRDPDNQAFMRTLLPLARHFDALTVAEAVESAAEARFLTGLGIDALQGYHFGAPRIGRSADGRPAACTA